MGSAAPVAVELSEACHGTATAPHTRSSWAGAANLKIINTRLGPGIWSGALAVPATTVAQVNMSYQDATVCITSRGAAVTAIKVDSTTTGLMLGTSGTVAVWVPSGHSITPTYASTAPTWVWGC
jgi:hypothetical protein